MKNRCQSFQKKTLEFAYLNSSKHRTTVGVETGGTISMLDGKVVSFLTNTGAATCSFCTASPTEMQDTKACLERRLNTEALKYGGSTLHQWMRCADWFLKVAYRLDIRKARIAKNSDEKSAEQAVKRKLQQRNKMVLIFLFYFLILKCLN